MDQWHSKEDIVVGVAKERSKAAKLKALKTQFNFRKQNFRPEKLLS